MAFVLKMFLITNAVIAKCVFVITLIMIIIFLVPSFFEQFAQEYG